MKTIAFAFLLGLCTLARGASAPTAPLIIVDAQTAGIDGREWDRTFPGAMTMDAVHRSVLVRFPNAPRAIAERLRLGLAIESAYVALEYTAHELQPEGYVTRGYAREAWKADPPRWHVVAWPLRRPWTSDARTGPTFNAFAAGSGYWAKYGAADTALDRHATRVGPEELSFAVREAHLDVTEVLTSRAYAAKPAERLRILGEYGLLLSKLEGYDSRYRDDNAAEWAVATGGNGLTFGNPRLVVTFRRAPAVVLREADLAPRKAEVSGSPSAVMPSREELAARTASVRRMVPPGWQRERIGELERIGGDPATTWELALRDGDYARYAKLVRELLAVPPRYWQGWHVHDELLVWNLYRDFLPAYARDHVKAYWESWLMPGVPTAELFHPQSEEAAGYWKRTGDWRGRASFFRAGYNYGISTQNFNHTAAMGALLGGAIVDSRLAIEDGRHGLEALPLRLWAMSDGGMQEMLDHYYLSITWSGQKMMADFAPSSRDRLMARFTSERTLDLVASAYHPMLRRIVSPSGRTNLQQVLLTQDGIYTALHTLSRKGTLNYLDRPFDAAVNGMKVWSVNVPPGRVAMQATVAPWGPDWVTRVIDDKPFPFEETSTETVRGSFKPPLWRRVYLGHHYGLASQDIKGDTVDFIAQWNRTAQPVRAMEELGTLTLRYAVNAPTLAATRGGMLPHAGGVVTFQHRNRAIVFTKPRSEKTRVVELAGAGGIRSLASVIALWNFEASPRWEIFADGVRITRFPASLKAGQLITIKDGATFLGIIPLAATDLGRRDEVVIDRGVPEATEPNGAPIAPALTITSYNLQRDDPAAQESLDWDAIDSASYGGFVIEMGDQAEYPDFTRFSQHMKSAVLSQRWNAADKVLDVSYRSGGELMEAGFSPSYAQGDIQYGVKPGEQSKAIRYRRVDGRWPYLAPGIQRDSTLSQQGTTGRLEKNGATLVTASGHVAILQAEPASGTFAAYNPLPDPTPFFFAVPGGASVEARGKVGMLKVTMRPGENRIWVDVSEPVRLAVTGLGTWPVVLVNGKLFAAEQSMENGKPAFVIDVSKGSLD